ncbi:MAG TPA: hypothetical protein VI197_18750 [Polyangiaceae bacterium]
MNGEVRWHPARANRPLSVALAAFVGVLSLMLAPSQALASGVAPMCNDLAQSIEAPPTIWPHRGGSIWTTPSCPLTKFRQGTPSDRAERVPPIVQREAPVATSTADSLLPPAVRQVIPRATRLVLQPGHGADVYRPPRA